MAVEKVTINVTWQRRDLDDGDDGKENDEAKRVPKRRANGDMTRARQGGKKNEVATAHREAGALAEAGAGAGEGTGAVKEAAANTKKLATESHIVNRGTPVAPCLWPLSAKGPEKKSHPRGKPLQSSFPKYHELFKEPHHCKAAGNSLRLTAKSASMFRVLGVCFKRSPVSGRVVNNPRHEHSLLNLIARTLPTQCACFLCRSPTVRLQRHFAKNFETSAL